MTQPFLIVSKVESLQLSQNETPAQALSCEFCKICENALYTEDHQMTASENENGNKISWISGTRGIHKHLQKDTISVCFWTVRDQLQSEIGRDGRDVLASISKLKSNTINYVSNDIKKFSGRPHLSLSKDQTVLTISKRNRYHAQVINSKKQKPGYIEHCTKKTILFDTYRKNSYGYIYKYGRNIFCSMTGEWYMAPKVKEFCFSGCIEQLFLVACSKTTVPKIIFRIQLS